MKNYLRVLPILFTLALSPLATSAHGLGIGLDGSLGASADVRGRGIESRVHADNGLHLGFLARAFGKMHRDENNKPTNRDEKEQTPDTIAPKVIFAGVAMRTATSARIIWMTNEKSDSRVWLGTSATVDTSMVAAASSTDLTRFHNVEVTGLSANTTYFYTVGSKDAAGNLAKLGGNAFVTLAL